MIGGVGHLDHQVAFFQGLDFGAPGGKGLTVEMGRFQGELHRSGAIVDPEWRALHLWLVAHGSLLLVGVLMTTAISKFRTRLSLARPPVFGVTGLSSATPYGLWFSF